VLAHAWVIGELALGSRGRDREVIGLLRGGTEALGDLPCQVHLFVALIRGDRPGQAGLLAFGEVLGPGAQDVADAVERDALAASMAVDVLLDTAADLVEGRGAQLHDMERVEHCDGVLEVLVDGVLVAVNGSSVASFTRPRKAGPRSSSQSP
jgi:hypothetical protein